MPALILGANLPDVDAACFFWLEGVEHLAFRRGITHGPPALVLLPLVLTGLLWGFDRWQQKRGTQPEGRLPVRFGWLFALALIGCLTHPALDWLNVYGIRLLEPFSSRWFHGDVLFIIDPWLWLAMGAGVWLSRRREARGANWRQPARVAIAAALGYIGLNAGITGLAEQGVGDPPTGIASVIASPPPLLSLNREMITGGNGLYAISGTALPGVPLDRCGLTRARAESPQVDAFLFWSQMPFVEPGEDGVLRLRDARYYDPRARERFTAELPPGTCAELCNALGSFAKARVFADQEDRISKVQIVWLRRDLRLADQPALHAAAQAGPVIPVYVLDDERGGDHAYGGASRWWLHHSLESLAKSLGAHRSQLVLRQGDAPQVLAALVHETGAQAIHAMRHYEPWWKEAEDELRDALADQGDDDCTLCLYDGNYLLPPGSVTTGSGDPYKIYTPFSKSMLECMPPRDPLPEPETIHSPEKWADSDDLNDWNLLPTKPDWASGMRDFWQVGEGAAHDRLEWWTDQVGEYDEGRNLPSTDLTSRLSPHLHWGEISPAQVWHALKDKRSQGWKTYAKEVIWRDYAQNVIDQFPDYPRDSYREYDERTLWRNPDAGRLIAGDLKCWQKGMTGYPIVDAGMRQLWNVGWMHNRVRMIAASFLVKHLLIDWRYGERWYWDCLVDADYGNNGVNWQWISGTGVDSNMFVRIMAPLTQSEKFDAAGYIREYVPELAELEDACIHDPPDDRRGDYPVKMIGHKEARERALEAYRASK